MRVVLGGVLAVFIILTSSFSGASAHHIVKAECAHRKLIEGIWGKDLAGQVCQVIDCESKGDPAIINNQEVHGSSYGLLQIAGPWVSGWYSNGVYTGSARDDIFGLYRPTQLLHPYWNLLVGKYIYDKHGGWSQWACKPSLN